MNKVDRMSRLDSFVAAFARTRGFPTFTRTLASAATVLKRPLAIVVAVALSPIVCMGAGLVGAVAVQGDYAYVGINRSVVVVDISDPQHPVPVGQTSYWPGELRRRSYGVRNLAVAGNHVYVIYEEQLEWEAELIVIDVSIPTHPKVVACYRSQPPDSFMPPDALSVAVSGKYAYFQHTHGLDVVDVSKPTEPKSVGYWRTHSSPSIVEHRGPGVACAGSYAYVADNDGGLRAVDVSDPAAPREVGAWESRSLVAVAVAGERAFVWAWGGLRIFDISDPTNVNEIGSYDRKKVFAGSNFFAGDDITGLAAVGNHVFLCQGDPRRGSGGLMVLDVSDPSTPKAVFQQVESRFVNGPVMALALQEDYAYMGVGPRLVVADVSDPARPSSVGSTEVLPCKLTDVAAVGDYAFLASGRGGLRVLDVSNAASPKEVGSFHGETAIATVTVAGNYAFANGSGVIHVVNVTDPRTPSGIATYRTPRPARGFDRPPTAPEAAVVDDYACVAVDGKMLRVLDISDPTAPKEIGSYEVKDVARVAAYGDYLLVLGERGAGLRVLDLSCLAWARYLPYFLSLAVAASVLLALLLFWVRRSIKWSLWFPALIVVAVPLTLVPLAPRAPRVVGRYDPGDACRALAVAEHYAYIVGGKHDDWVPVLCVVDLSDPASPHKAGLCELSEFGFATDVAVVGKHAYVVDDFHTLHVVDVSDPAAPKVICSRGASIPDSDDCQAVAIAGQYMFVTYGHWSMRVFDVTNPASPRHVCYYDSPPAP
jgi:hypothetical protein